MLAALSKIGEFLGLLNTSAGTLRVRHWSILWVFVVLGVLCWAPLCALLYFSPTSEFVDEAFWFGVSGFGGCFLLCAGLVVFKHPYAATAEVQLVRVVMEGFLGDTAKGGEWFTEFVRQMPESELKALRATGALPSAKTLDIKPEPKAIENKELPAPGNPDEEPKEKPPEEKS